MTDPRYLAFAAAYSQYGRAVYMLLRGSPAALERHRLGVIELTKETWELCRRFGVDERRAA